MLRGRSSNTEDFDTLDLKAKGAYGPLAEEPVSVMTMCRWASLFGLFEEVARLWRQLEDAEAAVRAAKQAAEEAEAGAVGAAFHKCMQEDALHCEALLVRLRAMAFDSSRLRGGVAFAEVTLCCRVVCLPSPRVWRWPGLWRTAKSWCFQVQNPRQSCCD